jgi:hypothetical protein
MVGLLLQGGSEKHNAKAAFQSGKEPGVATAATTSQMIYCRQRQKADGGGSKN